MRHLKSEDDMLAVRTCDFERLMKLPNIPSAAMLARKDLLQCDVEGEFAMLGGVEDVDLQRYIPMILLGPVSVLPLTPDW